MQIFSMNKNIRHHILFALLAVFAVAKPALAVDLGSQAPTFELSGTDKPVKLTDYRGKLVYLDFWASWCGPCRQSFPWMSSMQSKFGGKGLQVVGVNLDTKSDDGKRFLSGNPAQFTIAFDPAGSTPRQYGVKGMPSSYLIDRDGKIIYEHIGFNEVDRAELEKKVQAALENNK
jgi:peroxiredoxin